MYIRFIANADIDLDIPANAIKFGIRHVIDQQLHLTFITQECAVNSLARCAWSVRHNVVLVPHSAVNDEIQWSSDNKNFNSQTARIGEIAAKWATTNEFYHDAVARNGAE